MIDALSSMLEFMPIDDMYDELLERSGYLAALEAKDDMESRGRIENIMELKSNIVDYIKRTEEPTLAGFLEEVSLFTDIDRYDADADAVTMMTMHSAKGLEFPIVYLCGMEEGIFPSFRSMDAPEEIEEERRICYVAITRAKEKLVMTCAMRRMMYGQTRMSRPSRFIEEIDPRFIERVRPAWMQRVSTARSAESAPQHRMTAAGTDTSTQSALLSHGARSDAAALFRAGDTVEHKAFGRGMILTATPMGGDALLSIAFEKAGTKKLMAKSAGAFMKKV